MKDLSLQINKLTEEKNTYEDDVKPLRQAEEYGRSVMNELLQDGEYKQMLLKEEIEVILSKFGVDRAVHHSGDLVGGGARNYMKHARIANNEMYNKIIEVTEERGFDVSDDADDGTLKMLRKRMDAYSDTLQQFNVFFFLLYTDHVSYPGESDQLLADAAAAKDQAILIWRKHGISVALKIHILEDHVIDYMKEFGYMFLYNEQFVERIHQVGKKHDKHTKFAGRIASSRFNMIAKREHVASNPGFAKVKEEFF